MMKKTLPDSIPKSLQFYPPIFDFTSRQQSPEIPPAPPSNPQLLQSQNFTPEDRQSLKNAFRYICRLIFKQAHKYRDRIRTIGEENGVNIRSDEYFRRLFEKAEEISGERYFRKYIEQFQAAEQRTVCQYMRWFLVEKYLRYISEEGKGKRKMMKKHLYIKFKNQVMLPYIESLL